MTLSIHILSIGCEASPFVTYIQLTSLEFKHGFLYIKRTLYILVDCFDHKNTSELIYI